MMMTPGKFVAVFITLSIVFYSCFRPDNFPDEPEIAYRDLTYSPGNGNFPDTLILSFDFQDGNGDLGLSEADIFPPVHDFDFVIDANDRIVTLSGDFEPPFRRIIPRLDFDGIDFLVGEFSDTDNRPSEFDCQFYVIDSMFVSGFPVPPFPLPLAPCPEAPDCVLRDTVTNASGATEFMTRIDTFFIVQNENSQNVIVDFFRKRSGQYERIDINRAFSAIGCGSDFNARFPEFLENTNGRSIEGTLRYFMQSSGWEILLRNDTFRVEARIKDLLFNTSNTIVSPDFTLSQITRGGG